MLVVVAASAIPRPAVFHRDYLRDEILERVARGEVTRVAMRRNQFLTPTPTRVLAGDRIRFLGKRHYVDATITHVADCGDCLEAAEWLIEFHVDP